MELAVKSSHHFNKYPQIVTRSADDGKITFKNKDMRLRLTQGLKQFWKEEKLCDVKIKTGDKSIMAHRVVLAIYSDYFEAMFTVGLMETYRQEVELAGLSYDTMHSLLEYMYTGTLTITTTNSQDLLVAADMLNLPEIKQTCCDFIQKHIDVANCLGIAQFGEQLGCSGLVERAFFLVKRRFSAVCKTPEFLSLPVTWLLKILQKDDLFLGRFGEIQVFRAVMRWLLHDIAEREKHVIEAMKEVRFSTIQLKDILHDECMRTVLSSDNASLKSKVDLSVNDPGNKVKAERNPVQFIFVIGGYLQSRTGPLCPRLTAVEVYNVHDEEWSRLTHHLPVLPSGVFAFNMHCQLMCVIYELEAGQQSSCQLLQYDYVVNTWRDHSLSLSAEVSHNFQDCFANNGSLAYCNKTDSVYTVTSDHFSKINLIEEDDKFSIGRVGRLTNLKFEDCVCQEHGSIVRDGLLYVIGGCNIQSQTESTCSDRVSRYDPESLTWCDLQPMTTARASFGVAALGGYIYVAGGYNTRRLCTAERYDPQINTWSSIACMNKPRSHLQLVSVAGKLWACGGKSYAMNVGGARKVISSCEVYDPETDTWTFFQSMAQARCLFGSVVL